MNITRIGLFAASFLLMSTVSSFAQTNTAAGASNTTNVIAVVEGTNGTSNGNQHVTYSGHTYTTPNVPSGGYFAGANPCLVGYGAGGAGGPVGLSISFGKNDEGCQRRSDAGAWHALGLDDVAVARMCQDDDNKKAIEATGRHCPGDIDKKTTVVENESTLHNKVSYVQQVIPVVKAPLVAGSNDPQSTSNYHPKPAMCFYGDHSQDPACK